MNGVREGGRGVGGREGRWGGRGGVRDEMGRLDY